jgi:SAM-dependent methyltransferase
VDAVHLASRGVAVHATDVSQRMLDAAVARVDLAGANDLVTIVRLDNGLVGEAGWSTPIDGVLPFDGAYADFGALNTLPDVSRLLRGLAAVLRPNATLIAVVMGPLCPWEVAWHLAHREPAAAVRRWRRRSIARAGGRSMRVWYPSARRFIDDARPWFAAVRVGGIGVALPPTGLAAAMERRRWLLDALLPLERRLGRLRIGAWLADHWILELRRRDG